MSDNSKENPSAFTRSMLAGRKRPRTSANFVTPTEEQLDAYKMDVVRAIREKDVSKLRELKEDGHSFDACNRNGESLLHLACRRADYETVEFLLKEAGVKVDVVDSLGRTVLHDVCWRPTADVKLMKSLIMTMSPDMLLAEDMRGHTCFDYCRRDDWGEWVAFLKEQEDTIQRRCKLLEVFENKEEFL